MSLNQIMTKKEALCFHALRRWQRVRLWQGLLQTAIPSPLFQHGIRKRRGLKKCSLILLSCLLSPAWLLWWALSLSYELIIFPLSIIASFIKPPGLRAPGERNIKGLHYQFARYIELPPKLYIKCVDEWVAILYGPEKLPRYSLQHYLDADYLLHRRLGFDDADSDTMQKLILTQISNAREELSNELGHY